MTDSETKTTFGPSGVREVRAVFGPTTDDPAALTPVRAVAVVVQDDTELTVEVTGLMELPPTGGLDLSRGAIEAGDTNGWINHVAGRMSGLLSLNVRLAHDGLAGIDGARITRRTRDAAVAVEDILPGVSTPEAVATLVQDRDFVHRRVRAVEDALAAKMAAFEAAVHQYNTERNAWAAELREALTERDNWQAKARKRKAKIRDLVAGISIAEHNLAEAEKRHGYADGYNLNARDVHTEGVD